MENFRFADALTGNTIECTYPGLQALSLGKSEEENNCTSIFFPGCSFINYALPLVKSVYELLEDAHVVDGISLLCCGKILAYEENGHEVRAAFEKELIEAFAKTNITKIISACPNCVFALRPVLARDSRTSHIEVIPLVTQMLDLGYRLDADTVERMVREEYENNQARYDVQAALEPLLLAPKDSCPDKKTGEFASGLREILPSNLQVEMKHNKAHSVCCGSLARAAGKNDLADKQAQTHSEEVRSAGASALITSCVSCAYQLTVSQHAVPIFHYLEFLFNWRIPWGLADEYMKLRFLFDDSSALQSEGKRPFVGLDGPKAES